MQLNDYQARASKTAIYPNDTQIAALSYLGLKLNGEAGEVAELIGKHIRDDKGYCVSPERNAKLKKELGDVLWYIAMIASELGSTLEEIGMINIEKLTKRKEEGKLHGSGSER